MTSHALDILKQLCQLCFRPCPPRCYLMFSQENGVALYGENPFHEKLCSRLGVLLIRKSDKEVGRGYCRERATRPPTEERRRATGKSNQRVRMTAKMKSRFKNIMVCLLFTDLAPKTGRVLIAQDLGLFPSAQ